MTKYSESGHLKYPKNIEPNEENKGGVSNKKILYIVSNILCN